MSEADDLIMLEVYESNLLHGDKGALLAAINHCARHKLLIPDWAASSFLQAYREVQSFKKGSWDDVFGRPHPKGAHLHTLRQRHEKQTDVYLRIRSLSKKRPIDDQLFEEVGRKFGMSKTVCKELYAEVAKYLPKTPRKSKNSRRY